MRDLLLIAGTFIKRCDKRLAFEGGETFFTHSFYKQYSYVDGYTPWGPDSFEVLNFYFAQVTLILFESQQYVSPSR